MSTEPTTAPQAPDATWGDPQPPAPKWSGKKTAVAAAIAVAIAAVGGVAIYAGTSANSSQQTGMGGMGGPGGRMGGFGNQMGGEMSLLRNALHGDFTVSENGSYVIERLQTGSVSALTATSITVKSTDNYEQTYTIDSSTTKADNLATGSKVTVIAKVSGDTATATSITDTTQAQNQQGGMGGQRGGPGGMPGQQGGMPNGNQGGMPGGNQGGPPSN